MSKQSTGDEAKQPITRLGCHFGLSVYESTKKDVWYWAVNTDHPINVEGKPITGECTTSEEAVHQGALAMYNLVESLAFPQGK